MRRVDRKHQSIRKQRIWPTVLFSLLLSVLLAVAGFFGIGAFAAALLSDALSHTQENMQACAALVDEYCGERLAMAGETASMIGALDSAGRSRAIFSLQTLSGCDEAGLIEPRGFALRTSALLGEADAAALYERTLREGGGVHPLDTGGLAFTVKVGGSGGFSGVLYIFDGGELAVSNAAAPVWAHVEACVLTDAAGRPLATIGGAAEDFDYAAIHEAGLVYTPEKPVGRQEILRSGIAQGDSPRAIVRSVLAAAGLDAGESPPPAALSLWFENGLGYADCRLMSRSAQQLDRFHVRELLLFSGLSVIIVCLPLLFMLGMIISKLVYNRHLKHALLFDPITGGNNFEYFKRQAATLLKKRRYRNGLPAFAVIDVTRFRVFSDIHGQEAGELLLLRIYNTLRRAIHEDELITRYAVDQFSLLLRFAAGEDPAARVERMLSSLRKLYPGERLAYSAGIYLVADRGLGVDLMHSFATVAKDTAKHEGGDGVVLFTNAMRDRLIGEQQLSSLMDKALKSREFALYLQPKYTVSDRRLSGAEALVRWISKEQGFISPGDFIPLFENNGFIVKLDEYMLAAVAAFQRKRLAAGKLAVPVSVNISRANFADPSIAKRIKRIVDRYDVPHELIELELTESAFFDDKSALLYTVRQLKRAGFTISMDDFGSGYSSLNSLKDLPLDVVKLDKEFFNPSGDIDRSQIVIHDTIALAKRLGMCVVAEGIETAEQVSFLKTTSCDLIQGFYFAKPMPADEYENLVDIPRLP